MSPDRQTEERTRSALLRIGWVAVLLLFAGCRSDAESEGGEPRDYADLPGLRATAHEGLRAEYARLVSEKMTPAALSSTRIEKEGRTGWLRPDGRFIPDAKNAAQALEKIGRATQRDALLKRLQRSLPRGEFSTSLENLALATSTRENYDVLRQRFEVALSQGQSEFGLQHASGLLLDVGPFHWLELGARLEALRIVEILDDGMPQVALEPLAFMFRAAEHLDRELHLVPRVLAAHIRSEACGAIQAIVLHPKATRKTYQNIHDLLDAHLRRWPSDRILLEGERAQSLHTYELVRDGYILSILSPEELETLADGVPWATLLARVVANVDEDQMFYLDTMRRLIQVSDKPFYERAAFFSELQIELKQLRDSARHPWIADRLLLPNLGSVQRRQARDRATCEGWHLVLAHALTSAPAAFGPLANRNPETGKPYRIERQQEHLVLSGATQDRNLVVPLRPPEAE